MTLATLQAPILWRSVSSLSSVLGCFSRTIVARVVHGVDATRCRPRSTLSKGVFL